MENKKMEIGYIANTRGLKGEMKIIPWVDEIDVFSDFSYVLIDDVSYTIKSAKFFKNNVFLTLDSIDTIEKAEKLKNKRIYVFENDMPKLEEGSFYVKDLIGVEVVTTDGEKLGTLQDVFKTGSNDVYTVKTPDNKEIYLPAIKDVVVDISIDERKITVKLMEGLI